jgi:hypothetical protein
MANHCYNSASIEGSKQMLDKFEKALNKATKISSSLNKNAFYKVLGQEPTDEDVYETFGSRWFEPMWERHSATSGVLSGDSAWSPVSEFFRLLSDVYQLDITSTYEETGDNFGGWYDCCNGKETRDVTTTYFAFRYMEDEEEYMQNLLEDASEGYWESLEDLDWELLEIMKKKDRMELIEAVNKYIAEQG